ncbi:MAG TPA: spore coat protein U domain-containing protein [Candidatus Binatia bacterium]|nr:spore coat protein U domain-containing protein [Candidatus Binatia bacterium]
MDAARTLIWGDGTGGTYVYSVTNPPLNQNVTVTVYGRIPPRQNVRAGSLSSTVSVIINF